MMMMMLMMMMDMIDENCDVTHVQFTVIRGVKPFKPAPCERLWVKVSKYFAAFRSHLNTLQYLCQSSNIKGSIAWKGNR